MIKVFNPTKEEVWRNPKDAKEPLIAAVVLCWAAWGILVCCYGTAMYWGYPGGNH